MTTLDHIAEQLERIDERLAALETAGLDRLIGIAEVCRITGLGRTSAYAYLDALEELAGLVRRGAHGRRRYLLSEFMAAIGRLDSNGLEPRGRGRAQAARRATGRSRDRATTGRPPGSDASPNGPARLRLAVE